MNEVDKIVDFINQVYQVYQNVSKTPILIA